MRVLFNPVIDEPLPKRLKLAAIPRTPWYLQRLADGIAIAVVSGAPGWGLRGGMEWAASLVALRGRSAHRAP